MASGAWRPASVREYVDPVRQSPARLALVVFATVIAVFTLLLWCAYREVVPVSSPPS